MNVTTEAKALSKKIADLVESEPNKVLSDLASSLLAADIDMDFIQSRCKAITTFYPDIVTDRIKILENLPRMNYNTDKIIAALHWYGQDINRKLVLGLSTQFLRWYLIMTAGDILFYISQGKP